MMAASLRDRLWLSYALLIIGLLVVVATGVSLALFKNPGLLYPDAVFRIRLVSENASTEVEDLYHTAPERAERLRQRQPANWRPRNQYRYDSECRLIFCRICL